jgi:hypothetical protein
MKAGPEAVSRRHRSALPPFLWLLRRPALKSQVMRSSLWLPTSVAFGWLVGCSAEPKDHAPFLSTGCMTAPCGIDTTRGGGPRTTDGGSPTPDGGKGTSNLTGTVTVFRDTAFLNRAAFGGEGVITVQGTHRVTGQIAGQSFTLDNTDFLKNLWTDIRATSGGADLFETIALVDGTQTGVEVTFGRISSLASIAASTTLNPTSLELTTRAQIVLRFVNAAGGGVPNVAITQADGAAAVLYDTGRGGLYSDTFGATQGGGIAVLVNASAGPTFPGLRATITYKAGAVLGTVEILAVAGALTIADVLLQ